MKSIKSKETLRQGSRVALYVSGSRGDKESIEPQIKELRYFANKRKLKISNICIDALHGIGLVKILLSGESMKFHAIVMTGSSRPSINSPKCEWMLRCLRISGIKLYSIEGLQETEVFN
jgi:hypothetical protein